MVLWHVTLPEKVSYLISRLTTNSLFLRHVHDEVLLNYNTCNQEDSSSHYVILTIRHLKSISKQTMHRRRIEDLIQSHEVLGFTNIQEPKRFKLSYCGCSKQGYQLKTTRSASSRAPQCFNVGDELLFSSLVLADAKPKTQNNIVNLLNGFLEIPYTLINRSDFLDADEQSSGGLGSKSPR